MNEDDIALIAVPSYGGRVPKTTVERLKAIAGKKAMAVKIHEKIDLGDTVLPLISGNAPDNPSHSMPGMAPDASSDCVKCGLCAEKCPVGAIDSISMNPDNKKCISCMRCISICPVGKPKNSNKSEH